MWFRQNRGLSIIETMSNRRFGVFMGGGQRAGQSMTKSGPCSKTSQKMYYSDIAEFWSTDIHEYIYTHFTLVRNIEICIYVCIQYTYMHQHKSRYIVVLVCSAGKRIHRRMDWGEIGHKQCTQGLHVLFCFTQYSFHVFANGMRLFTNFYPHSSGFGKVTVCSHVCWIYCHIVTCLGYYVTTTCFLTHGTNATSYTLSILLDAAQRTRNFYLVNTRWYPRLLAKLVDITT